MIRKDKRYVAQLTCVLAIVTLSPPINAKQQRRSQGAALTSAAFNKLPVEEQMRISGVALPSPPYRLGYLSVLDMPKAKNERQAIAMLNYINSGNQPEYDVVLRGFQQSSSCLGEDARSCALLLTSVSTIRKSDFARQFLPLQKIDVMGKKVDMNRLILLTGNFGQQKPRNQITFKMYLSDANRVESIQVRLPNDPRLANTEQEYAVSGLYEAARYSLGGNCPLLAEKLALYRFFQEKVKPTVEGGKRDTWVGVTDASDSYNNESAKIPLCGSFIRYKSEWGSATWAIDAQNPLGKFNDASVSFTPN